MFAAWASYLVILSPNSGPDPRRPGDRRRSIQLSRDDGPGGASGGRAVPSSHIRARVASCCLRADPGRPGRDLRANLPELAAMSNLARHGRVCGRTSGDHDQSGAPDVPTDMGRVLINHGQHAEAIPHPTKAIRIDPKFAPAYLNMGRALTEQGRLDEAIVSLTKAVQLAPRVRLVARQPGVGPGDKKGGSTRPSPRPSRRFGSSLTSSRPAPIWGMCPGPAREVRRGHRAVHRCLTDQPRLRSRAARPCLRPPGEESTRWGK